MRWLNFSTYNHPPNNALTAKRRTRPQAMHATNPASCREVVVAASPTRGKDRRWLLKSLLAATLVPLCAYCQRSAASPRPQTGFDAETPEATLTALFGPQPLVESDQVRIGVAELAADGAVVPVKVTVNASEVAEIALVATKNPVPLIATFRFAPGTKPFIATRVKLAETSEILAVARTPKALLMARKHVEVTIGGCSG